MKIILLVLALMLISTPTNMEEAKPQARSISANSNFSIPIQIPADAKFNFVSADSATISTVFVR